MISNFQLRKNSSLPWLEVTITKDGRVPLYSQAPNVGCPGTDGIDPMAVDLSDVESVKFELLKCGRIPQIVATQGQAEVIAEEVKNGGVRYKWHPLDTSVAGTYYASFIIKFQDGSLLKWPFQSESLTVEVTP